MSAIEADLNPAWAYIERQGLVRVVMTDSLKAGFGLILRIGKLAEKIDYFPEVTLADRKVTIHIDDDPDAQKARKLAMSIDKLLDRLSHSSRKTTK